LRDIVQLDEWEMAEKAAVKIARSAVRLKYSVAAEAEINRRLPEVQAAVRLAVKEGRPWELDVQAIFLDNGDPSVYTPHLEG
jgi:hypothetical protein